MRHPSEYTTTPFGGMHVMEVDVGTVIKDERSGRNLTVEEGSFVFKGNVIFTTAKGFAAIRRAALRSET